MEHIILPKVEKVQLVDKGSSYTERVGTLYLTAFHTVFLDNEVEDHNELWVLHSLVCNIKKQSCSASGYPLLIQCKNFQHFQLIIPQESDCNDVFRSLMRLSRAERYEELYCFSFKPNFNKAERDKNWDFIDLKAEYNRMEVPNKLWHLTSINRDYRVCDTYPSDLFVPKSATLPVIIGSSKFRSRGRFPTLSYYCKETQAAICRSSQPLSGFSARCLEDEQMLEAIMKSNPSSRFMYVVDTRPKLNAIANRVTGKGYENEDTYTNIKFQFLGIENIHVMRSSQQKLMEVSDLSFSSMGEFLLGLENSDWLKHIRSILAAGIFVAKAVAEEGISVLIHCSDGWDRTAQVCSIASVLLDPFYRTLKGFMVLMEKDWVSFGHKFSHRYSHLHGDAKEASPVIDQFLECVWQLMEQFPCAFQYNQRFLISIQSHINSCHYGNFICNSEKERKRLCVREKTHSIWAHLWTNKLDYVNPLFRKDHRQTQGVLHPITAPYCFKFWTGLYNQCDRGLHPRQSALERLAAVKEETQQLKVDLDLCEQKLAATLVKKPRKKKHAPVFISLANTPPTKVQSLYGDAPKSSESGESRSKCRASNNAIAFSTKDGIVHPDKNAFNAA